MLNKPINKLIFNKLIKPAILNNKWMCNFYIKNR